MAATPPAHDNTVKAGRSGETSNRGQKKSVAQDAPCNSKCSCLLDKAIKEKVQNNQGKGEENSELILEALFSYDLENDLKNVKDQLCSSEKSKKQAQRDADESNQELSVLSSKLEESEKKLLELSASRNALTVELSETSEERDRSLQAELEALHKQQLQESVALASALDEIERLKAQLAMVAASEANNSESAPTELHNLNEALVVVEEMKKQLSDSKKSEAEAQELVGETLMQLEAAKKMVETLRWDGCKAAASELEQSRARVELQITVPQQCI
ncbi:interactor of constitutive active ROPs 2, chloroplastic-like [Salvia miltiorrhiza]|uniref:interactor of constitutive active ROPs 2, chloroplastic-like n=1 Tax=Salvia miltiorrhiza TaxID=226208 RepID=UPI0025AD6EAA|nr:interactor of constitutive active ROPs 2, chloroplastic-like [Salvia miltiorrhiza]